MKGRWGRKAILGINVGFVNGRTVPMQSLLFAFVAMVAVCAALALALVHHAYSAFQPWRAVGIGASVLGAIAATDLLLATSGVLSDRETLPPSVAKLLVPSVVLNLVFCLCTPTGKHLACALPVWMLVGFQAFRLMPEAFLHAGWSAGVLPAQTTFPPDGRNVDVIIGAIALALGGALWWGDCEPGPVPLTLGFGLLGICSLVNIAFTAVVSLTTPLREAMAPGFGDLSLVVEPPYILLPGLLVQFALAGHLLLFRRIALGEKAVRSYKWDLC